MRALVVEDGYGRGALAAVRGLGEAGWVAGVGSPGRPGLASWSRHVSRWHDIPSPNIGVDAFVDGVNRAITESGYELVFGAGDAEVIALSMERERINAVIPYADHDIFMRAINKISLADEAAAVGMAVPAMLSADDVARLPPDRPVVVKAQLHSSAKVEAGAARYDAVVVRGAEAARARSRMVESLGGEPFVQEAISGDLLAYSVLADRSGAPVAAVCQVAERVWPPGAGLSVRARTIPADDALAEHVAALLARLRWFGLAQLQFLRPPGGAPVLIDFNPRFYGSLALARAAGVNFPAVWAALATSRPPPPSVAPRPAVRYQWLEGDLRRAAQERRPGLIRDVAGCLLYAPGATHSIWDRNDPRPFLRYVLHLAGRAVRKAARMLTALGKDKREKA